MTTEPHCPKCRLPEPDYWCWEHRILCPLEKPLRDHQDYLPALRTVIWLLAELKYRQ